MQQLTTQRVMVITLFVLLFVMAIRVPTDTDTWWHIRTGEKVLDSGFHLRDSFSSTKAGEEWLDNRWGSHVILYIVWELAGNVGLAFYTAIIATAGMAMLYGISDGNVYIKAFIVILGAATASIFWAARSQMFTFLFSAAFLYILYRYKRGQKDQLWLLPVLMTLWGNLHAGFPFGFILTGTFIIGAIIDNMLNPEADNVIDRDGIRKLVIVSVACIIALVINPYGLQILKIPFNTVGVDALRDGIQEWQSPNFQQRSTWPFIFMVIALLGLLGNGAKKIGWTDFFLLSGTLFMALNYSRNIALFATVATPILSFHAAAFLEKRGWVIHPTQRVTKAQTRLNAVLLLMIVLGGLIAISQILSSENIRLTQEQKLPVRVTEFLAEERPQGLMFNSYNWGGYLLFALPDYPVYVDGRTDLYGDEVLRRYLITASGLKGWETVLDEDNINFAVIETGSGLAARLTESDQWRQIYPNAVYEDDPAAVVFVRTNEAD